MMSELQIAFIVFGVLLVAAVWAYNKWQEQRHRRDAGGLLPDDAPDVLMQGSLRDLERNEPQMSSSLQDNAGADASYADLAASYDDANADDLAWEAQAAPLVQQEQPLEAGDLSQESPPDSPQPPRQPQQPQQPVQQNMPDDEQQDGRPATLRPAPPLPVEWADGVADCLLRMEFVTAVTFDELWSAHSDWSQRIDKPLQWLALDDENNRWRVLAGDEQGETTQLAAALQLADRRGPVSKETLDNFLDGAHRLARRYSGLVELPEREEVLKRAADLDAFCASVDLQLTLYVAPRSGSLNEMVGARLQPLLDKAGLKLEGERFVACDHGGAEQFTLACRTAGGEATTQIGARPLTSVILRLDVPRVGNGVHAFERMLEFARQCAAALNGQLADANGKPLAETALASIGARIEDLQGRMTRHGVAAGGVRALRLYS